MEASAVLAGVRSVRQLSMNALSDLSGVPVSTISRIEAGKVEPTWVMMARLVGAAGFRLETQVSESGSDEPFAVLLRKLVAADPVERDRLIRRFPATARLALVAKRNGVRRVELSAGLPDVLAALERQGVSPVVSSLEAFAGDVSRVRSFTPVVYVERPEEANLTPATRTSRLVMFLLPVTDNVRAVSHDVGVRMVCREWALLDSLASPGRQADVTLPLLESLTLETV
ncbi:MAG: helix-turn-helix transcriptional regulator [Propionibacteriaceae bacterium]|nr:helix-turn-helix transcriptional regulator [Propionibacteriaceae bacterium]